MQPKQRSKAARARLNDALPRLDSRWVARLPQPIRPPDTGILEAFAAPFPASSLHSSTLLVGHLTLCRRAAGAPCFSLVPKSGRSVRTASSVTDPAVPASGAPES
ncbi:hypothetical protein VTO42DRAFT_2284 [Malbranchea cinnamomea]